MSENSEISIESPTRAPGWPNVNTCINEAIKSHEYTLSSLAFTKKCYDEALRIRLRSMMKKVIDQEIIDGVHDNPDWKFSEMAKKSKSESRMITISLPDNVYDKLEEFNKIIRTRKFLMKSTMWVYEQRGDNEDNMGKGLHIHILCPRTDKYPVEIKRDLAKPFNITKNFVHIRDIDTDIGKNYLLGGKQEESKKIKMYYDKVMRAKYHIEEYYTK
jgi:hypothetical protein